MLETINVAMTPRHPLGMTPSALALSPDQKQLLRRLLGRERGRGGRYLRSAQPRARDSFRPAGIRRPRACWPTAACVVLNGRGLAELSESRTGPIRPSGRERRQRRSRASTSAHLQTGTMSVIDPLTDEALDEYTQTALSLSPYRDANLDVRISSRQRDLFEARRAVADRARDLHRQGESHLRSGVRQDRQGQRRSVARCCSTNRHAQSLQAGARVRAVRQFLRQRRRERRRPQLVHRRHRAGLRAEAVAEQLRQAGANTTTTKAASRPTLPPAGYLWTNALSAGLPMRNYGYFVKNKHARRRRRRADRRACAIPSLRPITNMSYRGFDLDYPDVERAQSFSRRPEAVRDDRATCRG